MMSILRITTLIFTFFLIAISGNAQVTLCLGEDATLCQGSSVSIIDCDEFGGGVNVGTDPYISQQIAYAPDPFDVGTSVNLSDDAVSGALPIGFQFCFWGNTYTQFYIGSNGWISFSAGQPTAYTSAIIPSTAANVPKNCIMSPWQDWHPGTGSNVGNYIKYQVYGTAPNRRLVVSWNQIPMFSCTSTLGTFQIAIFESSNNIETRIQNKPNCTSWAGGTATHGMHNINGTQAYTIAGRNSTQWVTTNEAYLFTPGNFGVVWRNTLGQTFPYNGGILNIPAVQNGTVGYWISASGGCSGGSANSDTTWITRVSATVSATSTTDFCTSGLGSVTANPTSGVPPYQFSWPQLGASTQTVNNVVAGTYTVSMIDGNGCAATATVVVQDTPASFSATSTVVACPGGNDGTATATMTPELGNITYQWNDPLNQTTQIAVGLSAGFYTCTITSDVGCVGTVNVDVTEIPGMQAVVASSTDVTCNSHNDGIILINVTQGTAPYTYSWDTSSSTSQQADDLFAGTHTVTVTDQNNCVTSVQHTIGEPAPLNISFLTPDTQICPEDNIELFVTGTGGSSTYTFTWKQGTTVLGTGSSIVVDPEVSNTQYCVELSEACGSPTTEECMVISFPVPIEPHLTPDITEMCQPGIFVFENTSINGGEIATAFFDFQDQQFGQRIGTDTISHTYIGVGDHSIILTLVSIYGCVYTDTMVNIVRVLPVPVADFVLSNNPGTIFETVTTAQNASTPDVIDWQWYSPGSTPSISNLSSPTFVFPEDQLGQYPITLIVTTEMGCTDTITHTMHIIDDILFYAPNAFTPDGDEFNQKWRIYAAGIDIFEFDLYIFNRWGEIIWESHDPEAAWDGTYKGKLVPAGTYVWKARVKSNRDDGKHNFSGVINILR